MKYTKCTNKDITINKCYCEQRLTVWLNYDLNYYNSYFSVQIN